jgi:hypothetical protein
MKRTLIFTKLLVLSALSIHSQIPNFSFENWTEYQQHTPRHWVVNGSAQRVNGKNGAALRLSHESGALPSFAAQADLSEGGFFGFPLPGFAYKNVPDSVNILVRTNLAVGDTAQVLIVFTKAGIPISIETMRIWGNSAGAWTSSGIRMGNSGVAVDSGLIIISSVASDLVALQSGYLDVDSIYLTDASRKLMPSVPNAGFELWDSVQLLQPDRYLSSDRLFSNVRYAVRNVDRETKGHTGNYSLKLRTGLALGPNGFDTLGASVFTSVSNNPLDADPERPSFPVNARYASLRGYYELRLISAGDTAQVEVNFFYQGSLVGNGVWRSGTSTSANQWTMFSADINYDPMFSGIPDSATIFLSLMNNRGTSDKPGNWLLVDDLYFSEWNTSLHENKKHNTQARVYPNPASSVVYLLFDSSSEENLNYRLTDVSGRTVLEGACISNSGTMQPYSIPLQGLAPGHYLLHCSRLGNTYQERILVQP